MKFFRPIILGLAAILTSCAQVPQHDGAARVPLDHIVKFVKCDIIQAIGHKILEQEAIRGPHEQNKYSFLLDWAAKVHLTVIVDNSFAVNPGATFIDPRAISGTSFSVGVGAGLNTEAVRQEDVEFFLSVPEIRTEFKRLSKNGEMGKYDHCLPADGILLESDLGLKSIFDMALAPVAQGTLTPGNHPGPAQTPPAAVAVAQSAVNEFAKELRAERPPVVDFNAFIEFHQGNKGQLNAVPKARQLDSAADIAQSEKLAQQAKEIVSNIISPLAEVASSLPKTCQAGIAERKTLAVIAGTSVALAKVRVDQAQTPDAIKTALEDEKTRQGELIDRAKAMISFMRDCAKNPPPPKVALYDPLDLISETVNFYITSSGSVTPTWKLVHASAPLNSTFLSGSRKDTNTLILTMGRPNATGEASNAMNAQIQAALLSQAIQTSPLIRP